MKNLNGNPLEQEQLPLVPIKKKKQERKAKVDFVAVPNSIQKQPEHVVPQEVVISEVEEKKTMKTKSAHKIQGIAHKEEIVNEIVAPKKRGRKAKEQKMDTTNNDIVTEPVMPLAVENKKVKKLKKVKLQDNTENTNEESVPVIKKRKGRKAKKLELQNNTEKTKNTQEIEQVSEPVIEKKKRGRKPKEQVQNEPKIVTEIKTEIVTEPEPVIEKKKRGRKPKPKPEGFVPETNQPKKRGRKRTKDIPESQKPLKLEENDELQFTKQALKLLARYNKVKIYQERKQEILFGDDNAYACLHLKTGKIWNYYRKRPNKEPEAQMIESIVANFYQQLCNCAKKNVERYCSDLLITYNEQLSLLENDIAVRLVKQFEHVQELGGKE